MSNFIFQKSKALSFMTNKFIYLVFFSTIILVPLALFINQVISLAVMITTFFFIMLFIYALIPISTKLKDKHRNKFIKALNTSENKYFIVNKTDFRIKEHVFSHYKSRYITNVEEYNQENPRHKKIKEKYQERIINDISKEKKQLKKLEHQRQEIINL